ncbi:hypothetical protein B0H13DRAFT_2666015 [Mycena leptocephala]|nr:hypothetical protein B0H13DRAFT_2666015 [Mycena leptocephala]
MQIGPSPSLCNEASVLDELVIPAAVRDMMCNVDPKEHRTIFEDVIKNEGSYEAAVAYFEDIRQVVESGAVFGASLPPPGHILKSVDIGPLAIFYHSTFPAHLQQGNYFTWNFYIGSIGAGEESIMPDWSKRGIVVRILGLTGRWEECLILTIRASTRVRISYSDDTRGTTTHELVFPPDPSEASIDVHYLK